MEKRLNICFRFFYGYLQADFRTEQLNWGLLKSIYINNQQSFKTLRYQRYPSERIDTGAVCNAVSLCTTECMVVLCCVTSQKEIVQSCDTQCTEGDCDVILIKNVLFLIIMHNL